MCLEYYSAPFMQGVLISAAYLAILNLRDSLEDLVKFSFLQIKTETQYLHVVINRKSKPLFWREILFHLPKSMQFMATCANTQSSNALLNKAGFIYIIVNFGSVFNVSYFSQTASHIGNITQTNAITEIWEREEPVNPVQVTSDPAKISRIKKWWNQDLLGVNYS